MEYFTVFKENKSSQTLKKKKKKKKHAYKRNEQKFKNIYRQIVLPNLETFV